MAADKGECWMRTYVAISRDASWELVLARALRSRMTRPGGRLYLVEPPLELAPVVAPSDCVIPASESTPAGRQGAATAA